MRALKRFCSAIDETREPETMTAKELDKLLSRLVKDSTKENGEEHEPSSLTSFERSFQCSFFWEEVTFQYLWRRWVFPQPSNPRRKTKEPRSKWFRQQAKRYSGVNRKRTKKALRNQAVRWSRPPDPAKNPLVVSFVAFWFSCLIDELLEKDP